MIEAGQVLNGRYKLLRPLGQGSQAFVWVAEHLALGSQVAVKLIDPELAKQDDARERFAREATAAAKLRSAHVVQILDHGIEGEQPFIVMELLEGEDLFDRLERRKRLTLAETSKIVTQVARALMRAHAEGIIHRDLKPENVFLTKNEDDELAKVLDFGVAKVMTPAKAAMVRTGVGTLIGTPHYMSPEQVKGLTEIDHRSDLWSLAVIAYQCVTGQLPFDSEGVGDLLIRITMSQPVVPSKLNGDLPPAFDEWFKKCCSKEPDDRFDTARELADALARAVGAPQAPVSQPGRVLVNLADSPDLDWGSLAGVRIPIPPRKSAPPSPPEVIQVTSTGAPARSGKPSTRLETLEVDDLVEVVESRPPPAPAPSEPPPPSVGRKPVPGVVDAQAVPDEPPPLRPSNPPASTKPSAVGAPPSVRVTPASARADARPPASKRNPFLEPGPVSAPPSSARALQSTVTGLASQTTSYDADAELENPRKRKATMFVGVGLAVAAVAIAGGVIRSRGGFSSLTQDGSNAAGATSATSARTPPTTTTTTAPPAASLSSSASSSADAYEPNVTKRPPTAKPTGTVPTGPRPPRKPDEDAPIEIELPSPDKEVPLRR